MKKKLIALLVAVALTIGAIPAYAFAAQEDEETIPPTETDATVETPAVDAEDSDILAWWETLTQEQKLDFVPNLPENDFEDWMYRLGELGLKDSHPAIDNLDNFEEFAAWWERLSKDKQNSIAGLRAEDENPQVWNDLISVLIGEDPVDLENNVERAAASRTRYVLPDYSYLHSAYLTNGTRGSPDTSWAQAYAAINSVADTEIVVITRGTNNWTGDMRADPWTGTGIMPLRRPDGSEEIAAIQSTSDIRKSGTITGEGNPTIYPTTAHITGHNNQDDWMRIQDGANVTISNLTLDGTEASKQAENKEMGCVIKVVNGTLTLRNVTIQNFTCWNFNYNRSSPIIVEGNGRLIMENCTIQNNHFRQRETDNMGSEELRSGAILMESAAQVTLTNTVIKNNGAAGKGSAIYQTTWSRLTLDGCVITGNTSHYQMLATSGTRITSAAVYMQSSSYLTLRNGAYIYNNKMNGLNSSHNVRLEDATRNTYGISVENRLGNINRGGYNGPSRVGVDIKAGGNYNFWGNALGQWVVRSQGVVSALLEADSSIVSDSPGYRAESRNHNLYWVSSTKAIPTTYEYYVQGMANPNSTNDYTDLSAGTQAKPFRTVKAALESIQARIKDTNTTVTLQLLGDAPSSFDNSGWSDNSSGTGRNVAKIVIKKVDSLAAKPTIWAASGVEGTLFQNLQRNMEINNVTVSGDNTGTAVLYGKQNNSSANLTLTNTTITGFMPSTNSYFIASGTGGGTITLNGCTIENNQFRKALFTGNAPVAITNSTLRSNTVANGSFIDVPQGNKLTLTSTTMKSNVCQTTGAAILWVANSGTLEINGGSQLTENGNNNTAMVEADAGSAVKLSGNVVIGSNLSPKNLWVKGDSILQLAGNVTGTVHVTCGNPATDPSAGAKFGVSNRYTATNSGGGAVFHPDTMAAHFVGEVVGNDLQWNGLVYEYHVSGTNTTNLTGTASSLVGTEQNPFGSLKAALQSIALRTNDIQDEVNIVVMHDAPYSTNSDTAGWDANSGFGGRTINRIIIKKADTADPNSTIKINVRDTTGRLFENVNVPLEIHDLIFDGNNKGASFYKNTSTATSTNLMMQNVTMQNFGAAGYSVYFIDTKTNQANTGTVSLTNCVIKDNNFGFAFFHGNAQATMTNCTISGNSTQASGGASLINVEGTGAKLVLDNTTLNNNTSTDTANPFIWVEGSARLDLKNGTKIIDNNKTFEAPTAAIQAENNASVYLSGDVTVSGNTGSAGNKNLWVKGDSILQLDNNVTGTVYVTFNTPTEGLKFGVSNRHTAINSDHTPVFYPDPAGTNLVGQVVENDLQWNSLVYEYYVSGTNTTNLTGTASSLVGTEQNPFGSLKAALQSIALRTNDIQDEVNIVVMHDAPYSTNSDTAGWDANSGFGGRTINRIIIKKADTADPNSTIKINVRDTTGRLFENVNVPLEIHDLIFDGNNKGASFYKNTSTATSTNLMMQNVTMQNFGAAGYSVYFIDTKTNQANTGTVSLTNCVIKDNNFGFAFFHGNAQATMTNCTISGNSTQASGGASLINVEGTGAKLVLDNTTLNNNTSTDTANPFIWVEGSARLDLKNGTKIIDNNKTFEAPTAAIQAENNASVYLSGDVTVSGNTGSAGNKNLWVKGDSILQLDNNVTGKVYVTFGTPRQGLKFGVSNNYTAINSDQTAVFYPDPAGTNLIGQVVGNDLQWKILRYVAEIVDKNGNSITDNNGQPYTFGSITEAVQQLANVREADGSQSCIIKLMDQSGQDDPTIKERYIDFGGNVSIVYLDLNGQTVMTQALVIPDNVTLVGMDTSGKLKNSATEGAPQGQLKVASGYTKGTMKDHKSGIIQLETSTAGDLTIDFAQNNTTNITNGTPTPKGIGVKMANSYPQYGGEYLPVMTSTASTLVGYPTLDGTGTIETPVSGFYETTYKFARFRLEPVKHHIVLDRTENKVVLGTYMMFQSNSQDLVDARWAIQETITAPNNAGSKSTYKNLPANEYGAAPSLGWRGPHFCYYVETTFEGNNIVKDALVTGNAYTLTNILKFRTLGYEDLTENQINTIFGALTSLSDMDNLNIKLNSLTIERKADTPYLGSYTGDYLAVNNAGDCAFTPSSNWEADKVKLMEQLKDPTTQKNNLISYSHKLETISEKDLKAIVEAAYVKATAAQQQSMRSFLWTLGLVMDGNGVITPKS